MSKNRCLVIPDEAVQVAFNYVLRGRITINKKKLIELICWSLNILQSELKANYQDVFLNTHMLEFGWIYDELTETYYKLYESFNETAKQVLLSLGAAGYSKINIDKAKIIINNIFGGIVTGSSIDPVELSISNKDRGIRLVIKKEDLR